MLLVKKKEEEISRKCMQKMLQINGFERGDIYRENEKVLK